jgi:hypothetical protein
MTSLEQKYFVVYSDWNEKALSQIVFRLECNRARVAAGRSSYIFHMEWNMLGPA